MISFSFISEHHLFLSPDAHRPSRSVSGRVRRQRSCGQCGHTPHPAGNDELHGGWLEIEFHGGQDNLIGIIRIFVNPAAVEQLVASFFKRRLEFFHLPHENIARLVFLGKITPQVFDVGCELASPRHFASKIFVGERIVRGLYDQFAFKLAGVRCSHISSPAECAKVFFC